MRKRIIDLWAKFVAWLNKDVPASEIFCPVCGYYCAGKGGYGCIDKPTIYEQEKFGKRITRIDKQ